MFSKRHSDNQTRSDETVRSEIQTRSDETIRSLEWNIEPLAPMPEFTSAAEFVQSALNLELENYLHVGTRHEFC